jgi:phage tail sheath protein FI
MPTTYLSPGVYVEEVESGSRSIEGVGTAVAAFVGIAENGPFNTPTLLSNWTQFTSIFGSFMEGSYLAHAVYGYFLNGGGNCYVVRLGGSDTAPLPASGILNASAEDRAVPTAKYTVQAVAGAAADGDIAGNDIVVEVTDASGEPNPDTFKLAVKRQNSVVEEFDNLTSAKGKQNAVSVINNKSKLIQLSDVPSAPTSRPLNGAVQLAGGVLPTPAELRADDYVGDPADRTGFGGLETVPAVTMVCVPDVMAACNNGWLDLDGVKAVQLAIIAHCELMGDRVAILDPPPGLSPQKIHEWRTNGGGFDSSYAALYWPWIEVFDPASNRKLMVPPSGHIAGVWGRSDDTRGVHKAPANEVIRGVMGLGSDLTSKEQELLNPAGINCIRSFPGRGIRVWGARTMSSDTAWRYLNVRRLFNYLEESILNGTQWVVFEPNDDALWARIRRTISDFLRNEWRKGALFGLTPDEAFYVKCDRETNPPESVDLGHVVCQIGVAPVKPAEFVIFRLSQFSGGASITV